jgi:hypothetical protein
MVLVMIGLYLFEISGVTATRRNAGETIPLLAKRRDAERSGARKSQKEKRQARADRAGKPRSNRQEVVAARHDARVIHEM